MGLHHMLAKAQMRVKRYIAVHLLWSAAKVLEVFTMPAPWCSTASTSSPVSGSLPFFLPPTDSEHASRALVSFGSSITLPKFLPELEG